MNKKYKSCADWGDYDVCNGYNHNITYGYHETKEQAEAVCKILEQLGYDGERQNFPIKIWIEEEK
mgnify:CR=1 FL=1